MQNELLGRYFWNSILLKRHEDIRTDTYHSRQTLQTHVGRSKSAAVMTAAQIVLWLHAIVSKQPTAAAVFQIQAAVTSWFPLALVKILPVLAHTAECRQKSKNRHILKSYPFFSSPATNPFENCLSNKKPQKIVWLWCSLTTYCSVQLKLHSLQFTDWWGNQVRYECSVCIFQSLFKKKLKKKKRSTIPTITDLICLCFLWKSWVCDDIHWTRIHWTRIHWTRIQWTRTHWARTH